MLVGADTVLSNLDPDAKRDEIDVVVSGALSTRAGATAFFKVGRVSVSKTQRMITICLQKSMYCNAHYIMAHTKKEHASKLS